MASQYLSQSYSERTLLALEQALGNVWQVLEAHDPYLASTLMDLADAGVTDAQELRNMALATLDLKRSH